MAKKSPKSAQSKSEIKVTAIVLGLFALMILAFMYFHKEKTPAPKPQPQVQLAPVHVVHPIVSKPIKIKPAPIVEPVVEPPLPKAAPGSAGKIAIITDDWGQSMRNCKYLQEIPDVIAIAILPGLPHTDDIAKCASDNHKVVMLHLPMEPYHNNDPYPPDYIIKTTMKPSKVEKILNGYLSKMPWIEGVNNHMGSKATEDKPLMNVIIKRLKNKHLFYVDSMTAPEHSVAWETAEEMGVPYAKRDVFLDNINKREEIIKQINSLAAKAKQKGYAIAIGHDRQLTMQVLKEQLPLLKAQGFSIVSIKDLLKRK